LNTAAVRQETKAAARSLLFAASRSGVTSIYKQLLGGGAPETMVEFDEDNVFDFGYFAATNNWP
jgi:hypothetical protein